MSDTVYEFTLDFAAMQPPQVVDESDPRPRDVPCHVVSRVKVPVTVVFDLIRALNET